MTITSVFLLMVSVLSSISRICFTRHFKTFSVSDLALSMFLQLLPFNQVCVYPDVRETHRRVETEEDDEWNADV